MKRKLLTLSVATLGLFAVLILVLGLLKSSQDVTREYYTVSATSDGQLTVHPPGRNTSVVMSRASVTNLPGSLNSTVR
jgi:hypothetical protein